MTKLLKKIGTCFAVFFLGTSSSFADQQIQNSASHKATKPSLDTIIGIEANLEMPKGAHPLSSYVRYYAMERTKSRKIINAVFIFDGSPGRIVLVEPEAVRRIEDGGCNVIELRYSITQKKVISIACNGIA